MATNRHSEAFLYCWTDSRDNKLYLGYHKGSLDDGYICSSKPMMQEYEKRPKDFSRTIIAQGEHEDIVRMEQILLRQIDAKNDPNFYNQHNGNGLYKIGPLTEEHKKKIGNSNKGRKRPDLALRNKTSSPNIGKTRNNSGENNPMFGKRHNSESIELMSTNRKGKGTAPKSEETKRKMRESALRRWEIRRGCK